MTENSESRKGEKKNKEKEQFISTCVSEISTLMQ